MAILTILTVFILEKVKIVIFYSNIANKDVHLTTINNHIVKYVYSGLIRTPIPATSEH